MQAIQIDINMSGFPEYGIHLLGPMDTNFAEIVAHLADANPDRKDEIEALNPYSIVLHYQGIHPIVAYAIKWEMMTLDGAVHPWTSTNISHVGRMETIPSTGHLPSHLRSVMRPDSFWFCSPVYPPEEIPIDDKNRKIEPGSGMGNGSFGAIFPKGNFENISQILESGDQRLIQGLRVKQLGNYSGVTFSLDGVLFEDGTMIGANTTGFFDRVRDAYSKSPYIYDQ